MAFGVDEETDRVWYLSLYHVRGRLLSVEPVEWEVGGFEVGIGDKVTALRVFEDGEGKINRSLLDVGGAVVV